MEKQKIDRIMEMILSNETLKEQFKENKEETINLMRVWLDAEEQGIDLDPYYSRKQAIEFGIQKLEHDLQVQQERGNIADAELIARDIVIKKRILPLIGKEEEYPEEILQIKQMEECLREDRIALSEANQEKSGPRL